MRIFDVFFTPSAKKTDKFRVKAIERNISQHKNGTFYVRVKRNGKLITKSLKTKDLKEARRKVEAEGLDSFMNRKTAREPAVSPPVPLLEAVESKGTLLKVSLKEALGLHLEGLVCTSDGTKEMMERCAKNVLKYAKTFEEFDAVKVWKAYRESGKDRPGKLAGKVLGSACNHMKWYLGLFVPWAIDRGFLPSSAKDSFLRIKQVKVNPRRIRVPSVEVVGEFLAMIETEDPDGAAFLRFLGSCGLRITGARSLRWENIDFERKEMVVRMKKGGDKVFPLTPEAHEILLSRKGNKTPWEYDDAAIERLKKRMKRFAKGFDIDLKTFHAFRHYFASRCLIAGLTVQEVADLLGHSDNGELVLRTYGHLCREHLRTAVAGLRLVS